MRARERERGTEEGSVQQTQRGCVNERCRRQRGITQDLQELKAMASQIDLICTADCCHWHTPVLRRRVNEMRPREQLFVGSQHIYVGLPSATSCNNNEDRRCRCDEVQLASLLPFLASAR